MVDDISKRNARISNVYHAIGPVFAIRDNIGRLSGLYLSLEGGGFLQLRSNSIDISERTETGCIRIDFAAALPKDARKEFEIVKGVESVSVAVSHVEGNAICAGLRICDHTDLDLIVISADSPFFLFAFTESKRIGSFPEYDLSQYAFARVKTME